MKELSPIDAADYVIIYHDVAYDPRVSTREDMMLNTVGRAISQKHSWMPWSVAIGLGLAWGLASCTSDPDDDATAAPDDEGQSDWSGGPGESGPVDSWSDRFADSSGVSYQAAGGPLMLATEPRDEPLEHAVGALERINFVFGADVDDDGDVDILGTGYTADAVVLWRHEGADWIPETIVDGYDGAHCVTTADLDGDGHIDLLTAAQSAGDISWWRGDGEGWTRTVVTGDLDGAQEVFAVDMNGDGRLDLLASAYHADAVRWWNNGGGDPLVLTEESIDDAFAGPTGLAYGDLDGDGLMDAVAPSYDEGTVTWWSQGDGWTRRDIDTGFAGAHAVDVGDLDGDGHLDVVGAAYGADAVSWWRNSGDNPPAWTRMDISTDVSGAARASMADIDGDGDLDVIGTAQDGGDVIWWANDGDGLSWDEHLVTDSLGGAWAHHAVDLDLDGDLDLVAGGTNVDDVVWWELSRWASAAALESAVVDLSSAPQTLSVEWESDLPDGASLEVEIRSGDDPAALGDWSAPAASPFEFTDSPGRYLQYRVSMTAEEGGETPALHSIEVHGE